MILFTEDELMLNHPIILFDWEYYFYYEVREEEYERQLIQKHEEGIL